MGKEGQRDVMYSIASIFNYAVSHSSHICHIVESI